MIRHIEAFCQQNKLFSKGSRIVIACSGGPDSLALADVFGRLRDKWKLQLCIAHFEHGIRGEESKADAAFVRNFAIEQKVPFYMEAADVPAWAMQKKISLETAARDLRYAFLRRVSHAFGNACIATAHHADDQAETVLMHILRGTGTEGLAAMQPHTGDVIRPFLCVTRREIEEYCNNCGLEPRHDATNDELDCQRNRLRLGLLPQLRREYNPEITAALCRLSAIAADEGDFLQREAERLWPQVALYTEGILELRTEAFAALHPALQRVMLRKAVNRVRGNNKGISFFHFEELRRLLLAGRTGAALQLPQGLCAEIVYGSLKLFTKKTVAKTVGEFAQQKLIVPGHTKLLSLGMVVEAVVLEQQPEVHGTWEMFCDFDVLEGTLLVRPRQPGDHFCIANGTKKVKDFFIDQKIPRGERTRVPIFCDARGIFWLGGLRQPAFARAGCHTKRFLYLKVRQERV